MAKDKLTDYDATAANNTDVGGISVDEGMLPSNVNNAIREVMSHLKDFAAGTEAVTSIKTGTLDMEGGEIILDADGDTSITADTDDQIDFKTGGTDRVTIDSSGRVGIGTTSPSRALSVNSGTTNAIAEFESTDSTGYITIKDSNTTHDLHGIGATADNLSFYSFNAERARLESDGDLHVDGNVVAYSTTISDIRLKKDIAPIEDAVTKVQQLNGCTFTYLKDERKSAGLIAQDVEKVLPSAVIEDEAVFHGEEGETYKTVQYDQLIGLLVEAVKELKAEIEELKDAPSK